MRKCAALLFALLMAGTLTACSSSPSSQQAASTVSETAATNAEVISQGAVSQENPVQTDGKPLVAYFAYSENIGDTSGMAVDAIASASLNRRTANTEGNLQIMAQVIEEEADAEVFHILMEQPYDPDYSTMLPTAIAQMENKDWPALQAKIENLADYDVIYLGTPVWNGMLPPAMHTFFEENDFSGKTIIPFGINLGSGFGRIIDEIKELAPDATVTDGFTINASTANDKVKSDFLTWLTEQGFVKQ